MKYLLILLICVNYLVAKVNVAVSILPQKTFVEKIAGDKANVLAMLNPGDNPHSYEPKASELVQLSKVEIYFPMNIGFENVWIEKFKNQNKNMKIVSMTKGVKYILMKKYKRNEENERVEFVKPDPHTWGSTLNVKIMAKNIYNELVKIDSKNKDFYKKNYLIFLDEINATDKKIRELLLDVPNNSTFMVLHPSWGYFARDFGLNQFPIEIEGKEPKPKVLLELIKKAEKENIKVIFTQSEFSDKSARSIANQLKIKVLKRSALSLDWSQNLINMADGIAKNK